MSEFKLSDGPYTRSERMRAIVDLLDANQVSLFDMINNAEMRTYDMMVERDALRVQLRFYDEVVCFDTFEALKSGGVAPAISHEKLGAVLEERKQLRAQLERVWKLVPKWRDEQVEYPGIPEGIAASAAVRLCADELEEAIGK